MTLTELQQYFNQASLPKTMRISKSTLITDLKANIEIELNTLKTYGVEHKLSKLPIKRLINIKEILEL